MRFEAEAKPYQERINVGIMMNYMKLFLD